LAGRRNRIRSGQKEKKKAKTPQTSGLRFFLFATETEAKIISRFRNRQPQPKINCNPRKKVSSFIISHARETGRYGHLDNWTWFQDKVNRRRSLLLYVMHER
jgi:hypothetical protein